MRPHPDEFTPEFGAFGPGPGGRGGRGEPRFGRRGGRRGVRGDIRAAILLCLADEPMHGYQIIQQLAERSGGVWRASPGSIYPTLAQLADEGLVETVSEGGRNVAHLSESGTAYVRENRDELGQPWDDVAGSVKDEAVDVREEIGALMAAIQQVIRIGDATQVAKAAKLLAATRRNLYLLLAEGAETDEAKPDTAANS